MDPSTITATSFTLTAPGGVPIGGHGVLRSGRKKCRLHADHAVHPERGNHIHRYGYNRGHRSFWQRFGQRLYVDVHHRERCRHDAARDRVEQPCQYRDPAYAPTSRSMSPLVKPWTRRPSTRPTITVAASSTPATLLTGTVAYDAPSMVATFTPLIPLLANRSYIVTITLGGEGPRGQCPGSCFDDDVHDQFIAMRGCARTWSRTALRFVRRRVRRSPTPD